MFAVICGVATLNSNVVEFFVYWKGLKSRMLFDIKLHSLSLSRCVILVSLELRSDYISHVRHYIFHRLFEYVVYSHLESLDPLDPKL